MELFIIHLVVCWICFYFAEYRFRFKNDVKKILFLFISLIPIINLYHLALCIYSLFKPLK